MSCSPEQVAALENAIFAAEQAIQAASGAPVGGPEAENAVRGAETALIKLHTLLSYFAAGSEAERWHCHPLLNDCLARLTRLRVHQARNPSRQEALAQLASRAGCPAVFRASNAPGFHLAARAKEQGALAALLSTPRPCRPVQLPAPVLAERSANQGGTAHHRPTFQPPQPVAPPAPKLPRGGAAADVGAARWSRQQPPEIYPADHSYAERNEDNGAAMPLRRGLAPPPARPRSNLSPEDDEASPPGGGARGGGSGFQTAGAKYINDLRKEGGRAPALGNGARVNGLRRGGGAPVGAGGGAGGKFVPPFVKKALQAQQGGAPGPAAGGGEDDGPLSVRTLELLRLTPGEPLPEELARFDPNLIEQVCNEVIDSGGAVTWDDIAGQDAAKKLIQEVVVWPMLNPHIFKGARAPPKGILLFGPPGTGKTLLGKAVASNIKASFFSISASSLTSKYIGEGEKMVRTLFAVAGWLAPAVIFIDEIDSLLSARKAEGEHEASRRLKTELLVQMEGCDPASAARRVLLIGATNRPEELDEAARRRMPKQLYIPLPCGAARRHMVLRQLGPGGAVAAALSEADVAKIVEKTAGYSGSDMKNLIQEACQGPVRDAVRAAGAGVAALSEADLRPVVLRDFQVAAKAQRASVEPAEVLRYEEYNERHGAKIVGEDGEGEGGGGDAVDEDDW